MVGLLDKAYNISITQIDKITTSAQKCGYSIFEQLFWYIILPILLIVLFIAIIKYFSVIKEKILKIIATKGYIKILMITENKRIQEKYVKLDQYTNFKIKKRKYTLEKMYDFLLGYDKRGFPVFMYDFQFILPLKITKENINNEIIDQLDLSTKDSKQISAVGMKIDSNILHTVYKKKLISDLYSISKDSIFQGKLLWLMLAIVGFIILYYTGYLDKIIDYLM